MALLTSLLINKKGRMYFTAVQVAYFQMLSLHSSAASIFFLQMQINIVKAISA
jgi:hypothetical protein